MEKTIQMIVAMVIAVGCGKKAEAPEKGSNSQPSDSRPKTQEPSVKAVSLECNKAAQMVAYSFVKEAIATKKQDVDLMLYFDGDDCSQGAMFGTDDEEGYLFPVGQATLADLSLNDIPTDESKTEIGFRPITKDKEGLAFWVKTTSGRFALVRIKSVQPAAHADFASGAKAKIELECTWQTSK